MYNLDSCIAAIATAQGMGAIGIIRISGSNAQVKNVLAKVFKPRYLKPAKADASNFPDSNLPDSNLSGSNLGSNLPASNLLGSNCPTPLSSPSLNPWVLHRGVACDAQGLELDDVLAVYMPAPKTFTGEDCAELHCHGGRVLLEAVLESVLSAGANLASAGEFSYRAFVNGRIDLAQAEAIAELISASSRQGARLAKAKLDGALGQKISALQGQLLALQAQLCVILDFALELSGDEIDTIKEIELRQGISAIKAELESLAKAYQRARAWREGAMVVLAGAVNAGKSSLMNAILGRKRSLVSAVPGTTRDYIEENINLEALPVRLVDTAGLRDTSDLVEAEGVSLSRELAAEADYILLVHDARNPLTNEEKELLQNYPNSLLVSNKQDLLPSQHPLPSEFTARQFLISAQKGEGIDDLLSALREKILLKFDIQSENSATSDISPNLRQTQLIESSISELESLLIDLDNKMPEDILSVRLDLVLELLQEIVGKKDLEQVINNIFTNFCIGK